MALALPDDITCCSPGFLNIAYAEVPAGSDSWNKVAELYVYCMMSVP